jgi:transcriptional antiterminator NusG
MWCAVHVGNGNEVRTEGFVNKLLPEGLNERCFHLTRSRRKKFGGQWQTIQEKLIPGYVFIETEQPEDVYKELKRSISCRLLFANDDYVVTLGEQEAEFMESITNKVGEIGISQVRVIGRNKIRYLTGPLEKISHLVKRVDLHKRVAEVEADFMGEKQTLYFGIEIVQ